MTDSLENIKAGDRVLLSNAYYKSIETVTRVTAAVILIGSMKFRKSNGMQIPSDRWSPTRIEPLTPENEKSYQELVERRRLLEYVRGMQIEQLSNAQLQAILDITQKTNV